MKRRRATISAAKRRLDEHVLLGGVQPATVIGVVSDTKYISVREENPRIVYFPADQDPGVMGGGERTIYMRTTGNASRFAGDLESAVRSLDKTIPLYNVKTLATQKSAGAGSRTTDRRALDVGGKRGIGVGGDRALRSHQLWCREPHARNRNSRLARRGSSERHLVDPAWRDRHGRRWMRCRRWLGLLLSRFVRSQLYGVSPTDALTIGMAVGVLMCTALAAALLPALRASRIDPTEALRCE